ncbi:MAG TPA: adenylate/guanylate cyclase domain-containing protein [Pyrinomonadaceae bacterium]|jgi:class 3 adenylate cyclase|nr:adenylate/guanylate cyclase domain-containing protein [Pyrinomonadaceae bacterium]
MSYRELHYRWVYDLKSTPEKLWPFVADTNRFNRDTSVPAVEVEPTKRALRNARRRVRLSIFGMPVEWEEQPFEWVRPERFGVKRTYSKGPIAEMKALAELSPGTGGGTRFTYNVRVRPKSLLGFIAIPLQIGFIAARRFRRAFRKYDELASIEALPSEMRTAPLTDAASNRLQTIRERLLSDDDANDVGVRDINRAVVERLIEFIEQADDFAVARIKPYELADAWEQPRRAVLETCLRATRLGLLDLQWDLLCPLCRGPQESGSSLKDIATQLHCETCRIDFTVNFDRFVELTFRPNALIRTMDVKDYCIGSPQRTPHVVAQQLLPANSERELSLALEPGNYRFRALELTGEQPVTVSVEGTGSSAVTISNAGWPRDELAIGPRPTLSLRNETDAEQLLILERLAWGDQAATAAEVTALQIFRDLFSSEALRPGEQISVGTLTVLFTDLRNSTQLYREIGDATAFGRVMNHFDVLKKVIAEEDGALVKTIGDAVMAVFRRPVSALQAMLSAQEMLASPQPGIAPLILKAGVHSGPCIAVTLNDRLDYFGSTVNMAARLEGLSTGNDVIISRALYDDPEVREFISGENLQALPFEILLKGFQEEQFELWRVGRKPAAGSRGSDREEKTAYL